MKAILILVLLTWGDQHREALEFRVPVDDVTQAAYFCSNGIRTLRDGNVYEWPTEAAGDRGTLLGFVTDVVSSRKRNGAIANEATYRCLEVV